MILNSRSFQSALYNHLTLFQLKAMYINDNDPYTIHWPMKGGRLNLHSGAGGSLTSVCADLEVIWAHAIKTNLNIPLPSLQVSISCLRLSHFDFLHLKRDYIPDNKP